MERDRGPKDGGDGQDARMRLSILIQQQRPGLTLRQRLDVAERLVWEVFGVNTKFDKASEIDEDIAASLAAHLERDGAA